MGLAYKPGADHARDSLGKLHLSLNVMVMQLKKETAQKEFVQVYLLFKDNKCIICLCVQIFTFSKIINVSFVCVCKYLLFKDNKCIIGLCANIYFSKIINVSFVCVCN